jgi:hypothetical protein
LIGTVRSTHEALDSETARHLRTLYERTIDFGGHPNQLGLLSGLTKSEAGKTTTFNVPVLCMDMMPLAVTLHAAVGVAVGALKIFGLIYPVRFQLVGLDAELPVLVTGLNTVFKPYATSADAS